MTITISDKEANTIICALRVAAVQYLQDRDDALTCNEPHIAEQFAKQSRAALAMIERVEDAE
jgi:hypothetical protein